MFICVSALSKLAAAKATGVILLFQMNTLDMTAGSIFTCRDFLTVAAEPLVGADFSDSIERVRSLSTERTTVKAGYRDYRGTNL